MSLISLQTAVFEWWAGAPQGPHVGDFQIGVFSQEAGFRLQTGDEKPQAV